MTRSQVFAGQKSVRDKLAPSTSPQCGDCAILLVPRRAKSRLGVTRQHYGHGLCMICARFRRDTGQGMTGPRLPAPRSTTRWKSRALLEEYELLHGEGLGRREIADRLGVTVPTLGRALCRARRARERDQQSAVRIVNRSAAYLVELVTAENEAHRINDDMIAYALRKAG
jgi:hypothetical protein